MEKLKVKLLAYTNADIQVFSKAKGRLTKLLHKDKVEFVDKQPDVLVFLTGGSEQSALQSVQEFGNYLILASSDDNSWAAATEVKAWMNQNNIQSVLVNQDSPEAIEIIENFFFVKNALLQLRGQKIGLIGEPSEWLVNSRIDPFIVNSKLGVEIIHIPWANVDVNGQQGTTPDFISFFKHGGKQEIVQSAKVYEALVHIVRQHDLQAVTVECFSLIEVCNATACLALSKLSMDGIPAGCEGDMCSMVGMLFAKELLGIIPWMANTISLTNKELTVAHCTIPANLLKSFSLDTHFETNRGLAIRGELKAEEVTILRLDNTLSKAFVAKGIVKGIPQLKNACRTQLKLEVSEKTSKYFFSNPLGNHHIIIPGNHVNRLELALRMLKFELV